MPVALDERRAAPGAKSRPALAIVDVAGVDVAQSRVERDWHRIDAYRLSAQGSCPGCGTAIPGRFEAFDRHRQFGRRRIPVAIADPTKVL